MEDLQIEPQPKRPVFLSVLCILTFVSTGFSILGCLIIPSMADFMIEVAKQTPSYNEAAYRDVILIWRAGWGFYLVLLVLTAFSLTGAILMWNLKKIGFHFYTIANIFIFYLPIMWLGLPFSIGGAFFPAAFIGMYALHLKFMK
jgi:hypothetical protein